MNVIDKVKKLFALANDSAATEGEREVALKMAQKLLTAHNLEMIDLVEAQEERVQESEYFNGDKWIVNIAAACAAMFFCKHFYSNVPGGGKYRNSFVGKQSNVTTAALLAAYLIKSIQRESRKAYGSATSRAGRSFCVGAAQQVCSRIDLLITAESAAEAGYGLVVHDLYKSEEEKNKEFIATKGVKTVIDKRRGGDVDLRAAVSGAQYGDSVSLNNQIGNSSGKKDQLCLGN